MAGQGRGKVASLVGVEAQGPMSEDGGSRKNLLVLLLVLVRLVLLLIWKLVHVIFTVALMVVPRNSVLMLFVSSLGSAKLDLMGQGWPGSRPDSGWEV